MDSFRLALDFVPFLTSILDQNWYHLYFTSVRKRSLEGYTDQSDRLNKALHRNENAKKFDLKTQSTISCVYISARLEDTF